VHQIARTVAEFPAIEDVRYGQEWLDKVYLLRRVAAASALVVGGAFAAVAAIIISAAIRLAIFARREEISIMQLVGATTWFIRRPFLLEGLFAGAIGSAVALGVTYLVYGILSDSVVELEWIPQAWVVAGVAGGCLFGVLASAWAVHRHLQEL
jgi:cell division transport system permease protein